MELFVLLICFFVSTSTQYQCGIPVSNFVALTSRVYNGELARDGQWPWAAALHFKSGRRSEFFCSGTLVNAQFVLTGEWFKKVSFFKDTSLSVVLTWKAWKFCSEEIKSHGFYLKNCLSWLIHFH